MTKTSVVLLPSAVAVLALAGCTALPPFMQGVEPNSASTYYPAEAQQAQRVRYGTVVGLRRTSIQASGAQRTVGSGVGAVVGGLIGHQVGGGNGKRAATVVGAIAGGIGGNVAAGHLYRQPAYMITVRLDRGDTVAVTQASDVGLAAGQRVEVFGGGWGGDPARVVPAPADAPQAQTAPVTEPAW